jgi:hypothetical protein
MPSSMALMSRDSGVNTRRPSRDRRRMALINRSIFWVEERMKPIASGRSTAAAASASGVRICGASALALATRSFSGPAAACNSLVKPMTLTRGERRSWLTI